MAAKVRRVKDEAQEDVVEGALCEGQVQQIGLLEEHAGKDTWHAAVGAQHRVSEPWLLHFGVAYDSKFQSGDVSPALPANSAWRFGVGAQNEVSKTLSWSVSGAYVYTGTLDVDGQTRAPVALGGQGDLKGSFENAGMFFLAATLNWKF